jgi:hypothetical protein
MSEFANDLSVRMFRNAEFKREYAVLQAAGAASTLPNNLELSYESLTENIFARLLYCAAVFAQVDKDFFKATAQSIAFNAILLSPDMELRERAIRVLEEIGNFPGISYIENNYERASTSLIGMLRRGISEEINTVSIGDERISLTDYQKSVWDLLPKKRSVAISAPTSAGKSFLVIEYLCRMVEQSNAIAVVYIAPTRALLAEVHQRIVNRLDRTQDIRVSTVPTADTEGKLRQVFVLTQERLQVLLSVSDQFFDLVVVDEAQNISDGQRGMILQETIEQVLQRSRDTQVVMLAPGAEGFSKAATSVGLEDLRMAKTGLSPVLQNRILVKPVNSTLALKLLLPNGVVDIGNLHTKRGYDIAETRLAAVALELGSSGSLVYAPGPSEAEEVAAQIANDCAVHDSPELLALASFIEEHIHPRYPLIGMVKRGVAFHYGKMPSLLREAIEVAFKQGLIRYLVCTTTLFQGVNLPARNVFIGTPTRGRNNKIMLDPALLWNFAGRAGRMKKDIVGNVFLVDYDRWEEKPMDNMVPFQIAPAFGQTVRNSYDSVVAGLGGDLPKFKPNDDEPERVRAAVGLLISKASRGNVESFINRVLPQLDSSQVNSLVTASKSAAKLLNLPDEILSSNWTIDPFGQRRLYDLIVSEIKAGKVTQLIPVNPVSSAIDPYPAYVIIFNYIAKAIYRSDGNFGSFLALYAIPWMKGVPYPVFVSKAVKHEEKRIAQLKTEKARNAPVNVAKVVRSVFDTIENIVRFKYVQYGKVYIDLLSLALRNEGYESLVPTIFDFSLALELGIGTETGKSYIELGISRITAAELQKRFPNSALKVSEAREKLWNMDVEGAGFNPVIVRELLELGLIPPQESTQVD